MRYRPLFVQTFKLYSPRKREDAEKLNFKYKSYEEITDIHDRMRWCRHSSGLMQKEVAAHIGIPESQYTDYETGYAVCIPKETADRLAALYNIPVDDLLDDYNRFLYYGQRQALLSHRQKLNLKKKPYARMLDVEPNLYRMWEAEKKQVSRKSWEKYLKVHFTVSP